MTEAYLNHLTREPLSIWATEDMTDMGRYHIMMQDHYGTNRLAFNQGLQLTRAVPRELLEVDLETTDLGALPEGPDRVGCRTDQMIVSHQAERFHS